RRLRHGVDGGDDEVRVAVSRWPVPGSPSWLVDGVLEDDLADAARLAHHRAESRDELERVAVLDEALQLGELVLEPRRLDRRPLHAHDLRVLGRNDDLRLRPELLMQLLAGAHADELDRDVAVRLLAREPDHVAREV